MEEREAQLERTRQRVRELNQDPAFIAELRALEEELNRTMRDNPELLRALEAGEFRRAAITRRYGQAFADRLKRESGEEQS